jgi:hypothetical protein
MIFDLHIYNGDLFAAGGGAGFAGISYYVAGTSNGNSWSFVGGEFDEAVYTLAEHNGTLAAGGDFTYNNDLGGMSMNHVASYFGTAWHELAGGLDNTVHTLLYRNNALFAGGEMQVDTLTPSFGLAHLDDASTSWESDIQSVDYEPYNGEKYISSLVDINGQLFAGGAFKIVQMFGEIGDNIGMVDEASNNMFPKAVMDGKVNALGNDGNSLIMGGEFVSANFTVVNHLARTDLSIGIPELDDLGISVISDNAQHLLYIDLQENNALGKIYCEIVDISGKQIREHVQLQIGRTTIDVGGLSQGIYLVNLVVDGRRVMTEKVVLE